MIEQAIFFAARHKREPSHIGKHGSSAILPIEPQQRAFLRKVGGNQISANGREAPSQFLSISTVAPIPETAEPLITMCLRNRCARPDHFPTLAAPVARSTHVI